MSGFERNKGEFCDFYEIWRLLFFSFRKNLSCNEILKWWKTKWDLVMVRYAIWYHLYNLKNVKNTHGGVLILVKLQAPWVFSRF